MTHLTPTAPGAAKSGAVTAWGLWDWAFSAFNAVATTFVFNTYLSSSDFGNPARESEWLGVFVAIAGVATVSAGRLDDRLGAKPVIVASLIGMSVCAILLFVTRAEGAIVFWIFGLVLCTFVGPAQSASRTFLSRVIPPGREGEVFGLYATTGRAAIWMSPALYSAAIALSPATGTAARTSWGILGILVVIIVGLAVLLPVKPSQDLGAPALVEEAPLA